jgi:TM2 domain-containing membrane protein YozV
MRLGSKQLGFIVNFLLGVAWAFMFIGAITSFLSFYNDSILYALIYLFIGAIPGMVCVLLLEYIITSKEKQEELEKQTKLLQKILENSKN